MPVTFKWDSRFPQFTRRMEGRVQNALERSLELGETVARAAAPEETGALKDSIRRTRVGRSRRGFAGTIDAGEFYGIFQELGTRGRRTRRLKGTTGAQHRARRQTLGTRSGIKPHRFLSKGLRAARDSWPHYMRRGI